MRWLRAVLWLGSALGLLWIGWSFRSGNAGVIDLDLVWFRIPRVEVWWALVAAVGTGASLGGLFVGLAWLRQRLLNRRHRKTIQRLEGEVHRLRALPLDPNARGELADSGRSATFGRSRAG